MDFVLVGGLAALLRGASRPTADADLVIDMSDENLDRFLGVCRDLRFRNRTNNEALDEQLAERSTQRTWLRSDVQDIFWTAQSDAGPVDLLPTMIVTRSHRADYDEVARRSTNMEIPADDGALILKVATLNLLIESKTAADRPRDREALGELHLLAARSPETPPS